MDFSNKKTIEFTFEKRRHEIEQRVYLFDILQDRKVWSNQRREHPLSKENLLGISGRSGKVSGQTNSHRNSHGFHQLSSSMIDHFSWKSSILLLSQCSQCGKTFPPLSSMHNAGMSSRSFPTENQSTLVVLDTASAPICLSCRNAVNNPTTEYVQLPFISLGHLRLI